MILKLYDDEKSFEAPRLKLRSAAPPALLGAPRSALPHPSPWHAVSKLTMPLGIARKRDALWGGRGVGGPWLGWQWGCAWGGRGYGVSRVTQSLSLSWETNTGESSESIVPRISV